MAAPHWAVFILTLVVVVSAAAFLDTAPPLSRADSELPASTETDPTQLESCTSISEPGHYVLASDIESPAETCIRITADDVTFDGKGHTIDGGTFRENTTGIGVTGTNVTIQNVALVRWTFGVRYDDAPDGVVRNVMTRRTVDGVTLTSSPRARIERVTTVNGFTGISFIGSDAGTVTDGEARDLLSSGILVADARGVVITDATITRAETGIALLGSRQGRVEDVVVRSTRTAAVLLTDSRRNAIVNATLSNPNSPAELRLSNATGNRIVGTNGRWTLRSLGGSRKNSVANATSRSTPG
ncbi:NosD domain-containing protein [Haladaptatus sp. NG-SE-30]